MVATKPYRFFPHEFPFKFGSRLIKRNKGQIKIQQTIFMIIAVTLLFVLVGLFFLSITMNKLQKEATSLSEKNSMMLVSKLANSPEFSCGDSFGSNKPNCVDFDKVMALKNNINEYSDLWGIAKIEIKKVYPFLNNASCTNENYPNCTSLKILNKNVKSLAYDSVFIALCRKEPSQSGPYDKCELARLMISAEDKT
jgi:hypothetical protein